ncbi:hypothetical protein [Roseateles flavus]|uniref:Uncharacterized protein n=1 Tax=Roseateles flavus TaxID=3149041 RepID=A0ABV0G8J1_9BURK
MLTSLEPALDTPERLPFVRKLRNFMADHGLDDVPALVLQCAPDEPHAPDLKAQALQQALLQGAGQTGHGDWWSGFMGGASFTVFEGIAATNEWAEPKWTTEFQHDGHVLAGIRLTVLTHIDGVPDNIENAFPHFGLLVENLYSAGGINGKMRVTASLVNAKGLRMLKFHKYGQPSARELRREMLEWPLRHASNVGDLETICKDMQDQMRRVFP